jgi:hypothetical protein
MATVQAMTEPPPLTESLLKPGDCQSQASTALNTIDALPWIRPSEDTLPDMSRDFIFRDSLHDETADIDLDLSDCEDEVTNHFGRDNDEDRDVEAFRRMPCLHENELKGLLLNSLPAYQDKGVKAGCLGGDEMSKLLLEADVTSSDEIDQDLASITAAPVADPFQRVYCLDEKAMDIVFFDAFQGTINFMGEAAKPINAADDKKTASAKERLDALNSTNVSAMRSPCLDERDMNYFCMQAGIGLVDDELKDSLITDANFKRMPCLDKDDMQKPYQAGITPPDPAAADLTHKATSKQANHDETNESRLNTATSNGKQWWYTDAGLQPKDDSWSAKFLKRRFQGAQLRF